MIDLSRNRADLLAEIGAAETPGEPLSDITDPRVAAADGHVRVCGHAKKDLFPLLRLALSERFAAVPPLQLNRDLLIPLRNALGNAYKHGNGYDPTKAVSAEIELTRNGILIAVTDEGEGFDVEETFRRFQSQQDYFVNGGAGFLNLHRATSTVAYENGGRTVLLCFRPALEKDEGRGERSELLPFGLRASHLAPHLDAEWVQACLSAELPEFASGQARIESCRIYPAGGRAGDDCGNRYVLRIAGHNGELAQTRIFTGRLHATEAAAEADFEFATRWHEVTTSTKRLRIPRPVARLAGEPRFVLYDFDPWLNLWEYLTHRRSLKSLCHAAERTGEALAGLHRSQIALRRMETDLMEERSRAMVGRAETNLRALPVVPDLMNHFGVCAERIQEWARLRQRRAVAPIHGALGWDCIHFGVNGRFYLYRFEASRRSDPGLDLGGFAADLLCFALVNHDDGAYRMCQDALLIQYNSGAEHPMSEADLGFYTALALIERLGRVPASRDTKVDVAGLLGALDVAVGQRESVATSVLPS
jgi:anti-sigma regulatory factor (Ser/Thr protein kinase)